MKKEKTATCIEKKFIADDFIFMTYKIGRETKTMGICKGDDDFSMAEKLQPGQQFIPQIKMTHVKPVRNIQIPEGYYPIPHIKQIITR